MIISVKKFADAVCEIVPDCTVYLTGSAAVNDYHHGWSDIDMLYLTTTELTEHHAETLVNLRQTMTRREPDNPYYTKIEGGIVQIDAFLAGDRFRAVYWGTSGQRITDGYTADCFTMAQADHWILLRGQDVRHRMQKPTPDALYHGVGRHYETIRDYAAMTKHPLYRCGWMLDIARCLYTLKTGRVATKTNAGKTALRLGWCPDEEVLRDALAVRHDPTLKREIPDDAILRFNKVLGDALTQPMVTEPCYCGHDCGRCPVKLADDRCDECLRKRAQDFYRDAMHITLTPDQLHCRGGRSDSVMHLCGGCPLRKCCRERGLDFCIDCEEPCRMYREYEQQYVNKMGQVDQ